MIIMSLSRGNRLFFLAAFICFLPLIFFPPVFNSYEFPKFIVFVAGVELLMIILLLKTSMRKNKAIPLRFDRLTMFVLAFGVVSLIADIFGVDPKVSLVGSQWRYQGFITLATCINLFFLIGLVKNNIQFKKLLYPTLFVSTFALCLFALYQGISSYLFHDPRIPLYQGRIVGTMGNPNFLGGYVAMMLPFVLFWKKQNFFIGKVVLTILMFATILLSDSRSGLIAAGFVTIYALFHYNNTYYRSVFITLLFVGLIVVIGTFWQTSSLFTRDSPWDNRSIIWGEGIAAVSKRPMLGYGQENFELVFPGERNTKVDNAHNIFLETAVSSGIVGLILFLGILVLAFRQASPTIRLSLLAFLIVAEFNPLSIAQIALFWVLLGMTNSRLYNNRN